VWSIGGMILTEENQKIAKEKQAKVKINPNYTAMSSKYRTVKLPPQKPSS
jgi:hypothetical protein